MKTFATLACWLMMTAFVFAKMGIMPQPPPEVKDPVDNLYLKANYAQSIGNYDFAIVCWNSVLKLKPDDATAFFNRAVAYDSKGNKDKAIADLSEAIRLDPKDPDAFEYRAKLLADKADAGARGGELFDKATADFTAAIHLRLQGVADPVAWLIFKAENTGNDVQSLACWNAAMKIDGKKAYLWIGRGLTLRHMGEREKALADFAEALRLDPKSQAAYGSRAQLYLENYEHGSKSDLANGVADLGMLIQLGADKGNYLYRGSVYEAMGENDKAIADFTEAIRLGMEKDGYGNRARLYTKLKQWDNAIADYTELIRINLGSSTIYYQRASASYHKQDWEKAIPDLDKAFELYSSANDRQADNALSMRGGVYYHLKDWAKALADFNSLAGDDHDWQGRRGAAWLYATCPDEKFRDGAKAVKLATELCVLSKWTFDDDIDTLATAEAEAGRWDDAVKYEKMALKLIDKPGYNKARLKILTAHLALYEQKTPCREEKEPQLYL